MIVTFDELESFHEFVAKKLKNGGIKQTLEDCLSEWRNHCERAELIAAVRKGVADIEAGRYSSVDEVDQRLRNEFGFAPQ